MYMSTTRDTVSLRMSLALPVTVVHPICLGNLFWYWTTPAQNTKRHTNLWHGMQIWADLNALFIERSCAALFKHVVVTKGETWMLTRSHDVQLCCHHSSANHQPDIYVCSYYLNLQTLDLHTCHFETQAVHKLSRLALNTSSWWCVNDKCTLGKLVAGMTPLYDEFDEAEATANIQWVPILN